MQGQLIADRGTIVNRANEEANIKIDRADIRFSWDPQHRALIVPFQINSGGNQFTLRAVLQSSESQNGIWQLTMQRGDTVIDPIILASPVASDPEGFAINRAALRARIDTVHRRIDLMQGDFSRVDTRPSYNVGVAVTGSLDYSGAVPHLAFGVAATRMPMAVFKRLWPIFAVTDVRTWVDQHVSAGTIERVVIAGNAPVPNFKKDGPPLPDDGLSIDIETSATTLRPLDTLPPIRDADLTVRVIGRNARVSLGRGTVDVAPGRKLSVANGIFDVPDTHPKPSPARTSFRVDGSMPAAAALLASDAFRGDTIVNLDPASTRGTVAAQVAINLTVGRGPAPQPPVYSITADLTNFAADKLLLGRKVEASSLRVTASRDGYEVKGDVKINGTPATISLTKTKADAAADLQSASGDGRSGAAPAWHRFRRQRCRRGPGEGRRRGRQEYRRSADGCGRRSHPGENRQPAAGVDQGGRQASACHRHAGQGRQVLALRQYGRFRLGRDGQRLGRTRRFKPNRVGEFSGLQPVGRRQGHPQGRPPK